MATQAAELQAELDATQAAEIEELKAAAAAAASDDDASDADEAAEPAPSPAPAAAAAATTATEEAADPYAGMSMAEKKRAKAQAKRERKRAAAIAAADAADREREANTEGAREAESAGISAALRAQGKTLSLIPSDGNCMFAAIAAAATAQGPAGARGMDIALSDARRFMAERRMEEKNPLGVPGEKALAFVNGDAGALSSAATLRLAAAFYISRNRRTFEPFVAAESFADVHSYVDSIANVRTSKWGGQPELVALAAVLGLPIHVMSTDSLSGDASDVRVLKFGEGPPANALVVTYHRHYLSTGEHYNAAI